MKKIFFFFLAVFCGLAVSAQNSKARVGITFGATSSNMYGERGGVKYDYDSRFGFSGGLVLDAPIGKSKFSFHPSLSYVQKGATTKNVKIQTDYVALRYAELSANFAYNVSGGKKMNLFAALGPSLAFNVPSKFVTKTKPDDTKTETSVKFGAESPADFKGVDYGVNMQVGVACKSGIIFSVGYTAGLRNLIPDSPLVTINDKQRNSSVGIRLGYLFSN